MSNQTPAHCNGGQRLELPIFFGDDAYGLVTRVEGYINQ